MIRGERAAWGVLEVDSRQHRSFDEDDVSFLQNYANLIAAAIDRLQTEADLRQAADRTSFLLGELQHRVGAGGMRQPPGGCGQVREGRALGPHDRGEALVRFFLDPQNPFADKTLPPRIPPLGAEVAERVIA